jgi:hypothetical protein
MSRFGREWSLGAKNVSKLQIFPFLCAILYICMCVCVWVCPSAVFPISGYYIGNKMWIQGYNSCVAQPLDKNWWAAVTSGFQNLASPVLQHSDHYEVMFSHVA